VENVNDFLNAPKSSAMLVVRYYLVYMPNIIYLVMPIIVLIASLFSIMNMSKYNELTALKSAGISLYRIILPLIFMGIFISLSMIAFDEYVVSYSNRARIDMKKYELKAQSKKIDKRVYNKIISTSSGEKVYFQQFDGTKNAGRQITVQTFRNYSMIRRIDARMFLWKEDGWQLKYGILRDFSRETTKYTKFDTLNIKLAGITPEELLKERTKPEEMNYTELKTFITDLKRMGTKTTRWEVAKNSKLSYPFANLIILIFGATLASTKRRSGPALGFILALTVVFVYFFIFKFGEILGQNGEISPLLASWLANIVFGTAAVVALMKTRQ
jgi:lipopolysaccharide export system permease protein